MLIAQQEKPPRGKETEPSSLGNFVKRESTTIKERSPQRHAMTRTGFLINYNRGLFHQTAY